jgi:hypothetical protein
MPGGSNSSNSLDTAARLQKESSELSNASPSIPFLLISKVPQLPSERVPYGAALACGSCLTRLS